MLRAKGLIFLPRLICVDFTKAAHELVLKWVGSNKKRYFYTTHNQYQRQKHLLRIKLLRNLHFNKLKSLTNETDHMKLFKDLKMPLLLKSNC